MPFSVHRTFLWPPELPLNFGTGQSWRKELLTWRTEKALPQHPPSPPLSTCLPLSLHLALPGPLQGQPSRTATASCFKGSSGPDKSHTGWQPHRPSTQGCAFLGFCCCYPGSPRETKAGMGAWHLGAPNSPPLSPSELQETPIKALLRARQTAGRRERGQMGDWPKTSRPGHRAGPTEAQEATRWLKHRSGSSPKQQAFQGAGCPPDAKGLAWVRPQTHREPDHACAGPGEADS